MEYPKTLIYMPLKWCGWAHEQALYHYEIPDFVEILNEDDAQMDENGLPLVAQYHSPQSKEVFKLFKYLYLDVAL